MPHWVRTWIRNILTKFFPISGDGKVRLSPRSWTLKCTTCSPWEASSWANSSYSPYSSATAARLARRTPSQGRRWPTRQTKLKKLGERRSSSSWAGWEKKIIGTNWCQFRDWLIWTGLPVNSIGTWCGEKFATRLSPGQTCRRSYFGPFSGIRTRQKSKDGKQN